MIESLPKGCQLYPTKTPNLGNLTLSSVQSLHPPNRILGTKLWPITSLLRWEDKTVRKENMVHTVQWFPWWLIISMTHDDESHDKSIPWDYIILKNKKIHHKNPRSWDEHPPHTSARCRAIPSSSPPNCTKSPGKGVDASRSQARNKVSCRDINHWKITNREVKGWWFATHKLVYVGVSLNGGTPKTPQSDHFLVGKPMVVGYHHLRKHPCIYIGTLR